MLLYRILPCDAYDATAGYRGWSLRSCLSAEVIHQNQTQNPDNYFGPQSWVQSWVGGCLHGWRPGPWVPPRSLRSPVAMAEIETSGYTRQPGPSPFQPIPCRCQGLEALAGKATKSRGSP